MQGYEWYVTVDDGITIDTSDIWNFQTWLGANKFLLNIAIDGTGSVIKNPDKPYYDLNDAVQLTAVPSDGGEFVNWDGDLTGSNNPETIIMTKNSSVTAHFISPTNNALSFDGSNDYINVPYNATLNLSQDFTIETWLYPTSFNSYRSFINRGDINNPDYQYWIGFFGSRLYFDFKVGNVYYDLTSAATFTTNEWMHVAIVYNQILKQVTFYVNGDFLESKTFALEIPDDSNAPLRIGGDNEWNQYFPGQMDEVRIWNVVRTLPQIRQEMYHELTDPSGESNLVAYYRFNEPDVQTTQDLSQNNNDGVLGGNTAAESSDPAWITSTAPIPFFTVQSGDWNSNATWAQGQNAPSHSWSRVKISNSVSVNVADTVLEASINIPGSLIVGSGQNFTCTGNIDINNGGTFTLTDNSILSMGPGSAINVDYGGTLQTTGTSGSESIITHTTGNYSFTIAAGADISAAYTIFEYMDESGVMINGNVDPASPLSNCTFRYGQAGGTLLTFGSTQTVSPENVFFPDNTWGGSYNVSKTNDAGNVSFTNSTGNFSGASFENDPYGRIDWGSFDLDIKVFLEGPFNGTIMNTDLTSLTSFPLNQPYNISPWNYPGTESISTIPPGVVDWVLIELRDASDAASATSATIVARQAAFLMSDGTIRNIDGTGNQQFNNLTIQQSLFVVIWHRNHLGIMSSVGLTKVASVYSYDFTSGSGQAYGTNSQKEIGTNIWGMITGDANADGVVDGNDKSQWSTEAGASGYLNSDFNLNGNTDNTDKNSYLIVNEGKTSQLPN